MNHHDVIAERYKQLVAAAPDGAKRDDIIELIAAEIERLVNDGDLDNPIDYELLVKADIDDIDGTDRRNQPDHLQYALDALNGDTILGHDDPILDNVCAIGNGIRKTYRNLTDDDLLAIIARKQKHAADATAAASRTTDIIMGLLRHMRYRSAEHLGELWR